MCRHTQSEPAGEQQELEEPGTGDASAPEFLGLDDESGRDEAHQYPAAELDDAAPEAAGPAALQHDTGA